MIRGFGSFNQADNGDGGQAPTFMDKVKGFWISIPLITKTIVFLTIIFYILSWIHFFSSVLQLLTNIPYLTITKFRFWTIVTTILITPSILNIIFAFLAWIPRAIENEREDGSVKFLLNISTRSIIIQVMYIGLMCLFYFIAGEKVMITPSAGLWPLIMADISINCLRDPDRDVMFFFIPFPIKAKYYPWALLGFFTILNFSFQFDLICGVGFGYLYHYKLKEKIDYSIQCIQKTEANCIFNCVRNSPSFIPSVAPQNSGFGMNVQNVNTSTRSGNQNADNNNEVNL